MDPVLLIGDRGYSFDKKNILGQGGFGTVYNSLKGSTVLALKEVLPCRSHPLETVKYESECMQILGYHKNILLLVDQFTAKLGESAVPHYYMATEYCLCSIDSLQSCGVNVDLPDIKAMFHQMLEGLDYIHSKGIMHRDIKPDNVFLSGGGLLKIADFGTALRLDERYRPSKYQDKQAGTLWYSPPEMLLCKGHDNKMDVWSLGCTFAEMCISKPLFAGSTAQEQISIILRRCAGQPWLFRSLSLQNVKSLCKLGYPIQPRNKLYNHLKVVGIADTDVATLLKVMLVINPKNRANTSTLLRRKMFGSPAPDLKVMAYDYLLKSRKEL